MKQTPKHGWIGRILYAVREIQAMEIPLRAAYAAYFIILSVFPALLLVLGILRFVRMDVADLVTLLGGLVPGALMDFAERVIQSVQRSTSGAITGVSALVALWSASKGIYGLLVGLNRVYGVEEDRGYLYTRGISILYALLFLLVVVLTLGLHVFGGRLMDALRSLNTPLLNFVIDILNLRFFLLMLLQSLVFTGMFMVLPNRRNGFLASLPGGLLSSIGWQIFTNIYSVYVSRFSSYATLFGSVYAIAMVMLWLYCCLCILLYGGALNRSLMLVPGGGSCSDM